MEKSLPSRDTVQTLVLGIIVLTILFVVLFVSLLKLSSCPLMAKGSQAH
jgi:hypothetical protein